MLNIGDQFPSLQPQRRHFHRHQKLLSWILPTNLIQINGKFISSGPKILPLSARLKLPNLAN